MCHKPAGKSSLSHSPCMQPGGHQFQLPQEPAAPPAQQHGWQGLSPSLSEGAGQLEGSSGDEAGLVWGRKRLLVQHTETGVSSLNTSQQQDCWGNRGSTLSWKIGTSRRCFPLFVTQSHGRENTEQNYRAEVPQGGNWHTGNGKVERWDGSKQLGTQGGMSDWQNDDCNLRSTKPSVIKWNNCSLEKNTVKSTPHQKRLSNIYHPFH